MISRLLVVVLAVSLLTAGCLGGGVSPAAPVEGGSGDGAGGGGDGSDGSDGGAGGADDIDLADPENALREAGSFTATWRYTGTDENGVRSEVGYVYAADLDAERAHVTFTSGDTDETAGGSWEMFTADGVTYARYASEDAAFYQRQDEGVDVLADATSHAGIYSYGDVDDLNRRGTETYDGVTVTRYEISGVDEWWAASAASADGEFTITDFSYVVLVDENGLSRYESWSFSGRTADGATVNGAWEYTLTDVGSTTVEDPAWLAEAKSQTR